MQQTAFDQWLRRKFVHETMVYCNTLPPGLGPQFHVEEAAVGEPSSHRYRIRPWNDEALLELVDQFRMEGITYSASIEDRAGFLAGWMARPGRSVTCEAIWFILAIVGGGCLLYFFPWMKVIAFAKTALSP